MKEIMNFLLAKKQCSSANLGVMEEHQGAKASANPVIIEIISGAMYPTNISVR